MDKLDIMRAIKSRGFFAKDIAEKLGISVVAMSQRANKDNPTVKSLREVAEIIGCDVRDLFYKVDENGNIIEDEHQAQDLFSLERLPNIEDKTDSLASQQKEDALPEAEETIAPLQQITATFCPHCGKRVRVGVVLLAEE